VIAVVRQRWRAIERLEKGDLWLAVESVRSPGNLGTLLRTSLAVGARGLFVLGDADPFDPACVRATMGALESLVLARVTREGLVRLVREARGRLVGAAPQARVDFRAAAYGGTTVVVLGSERSGLTDQTRGACDTLVRIPMAFGVDSLNLAVAGSVLLYEALRQRDRISPRGPSRSRPSPPGSSARPCARSGR
jgi:TrmH family RNA methyltransferase